MTKTTLTAEARTKLQKAAEAAWRRARELDQKAVGADYGTSQAYGKAAHDARVEARTLDKLLATAHN